MGLFSRKTPEEKIDEAVQLMDSEQFEAAAKLLAPLAQEGYVVAMLHYANCLIQTDQYHFDAAIGYILEASEAIDDPDIQDYADELLGVISACVNEQFALGEEAFANHRLRVALEWYNLAAENNHVKAMYTLAKLYRNGDVAVDKNTDLAVKWFTRAANLGDADSMSALADMYHLGTEVKPDRQKALYWYQQAAEHGDFQSEYMVQVLQKDN